MILARGKWAAGLGLAIGLLGAVITLSPAGMVLEEQFGLDLLFQLRGARPAPADVVVVSIDKESASHFQLPNEPRKWPRHLHAQLVDRLTRAGAAAIGFDIHFEEPRDPGYDRLLVQAVQRAGNVVLFEYLQKEAVQGSLSGQREAELGVIERRILPFPALALAAVATAPFPLPKVPAKVSQFWLFKGGAGDVATLPTVLFQLSALDVHPALVSALRAVTPDAHALPDRLGAAGRAHSLQSDMQHLRALLRRPPIGTAVQARINADTGLSSGDRHKLQALVGIYRDDASRLLNYYGPPRSIPTIPYYQVWQASAPDDPVLKRLHGKLVMVGFSERLQPEQKDGFYTVYSREDSGLDISGVEIAATALANMLDGTAVRALSPAGSGLMVFVWGLLIGLLASARRLLWGQAALALLVLAWVVGTVQLFATHALWLPLIVPLAVQAPLAGIAAILWRYRDVARERNRIRQAFRHYLPERAVAALARDLRATPGGELLHGVVLATDAARYTALAERLPPDQVAALLNRYYESLFAPVREYGGFVSDVVGDAMLAVWAQARPEARQRLHACEAALAVAYAAERFREMPDSAGLRTRIGLHAGPILLGNVGAADHFEYRAVGDIVNTASRLQELNKRLGTQLLVSQETVDGLDAFALRELGTFRLPGKSNPIAVCELLGLAGAASEPDQSLLREFSAARQAFMARDFDAAHAGFERCLQRYPDDGPSRFYGSLCERFRVNPPGPEWEGVITTDGLQA